MRSGTRIGPSRGLKEILDRSAQERRDSYPGAGGETSFPAVSAELSSAGDVKPYTGGNESPAPVSVSGQGAGLSMNAQVSGDGRTKEAISEFYDALRDKLNSYGVTSIPSFEALYGLFESFLRPSVDAAIEARNARARTNMAELDADAYARGMGGSSYISSMKEREQNDVNGDLTRLEGEYSSSMAEYLYKALSAMQDMESELERTRMTIQAQKEAAYIAAASRSGGGSGRSSGSGGSSGKSSSKGNGRSGGSDQSSPKYGHNKNGAYFDGKWYDGDFSYLSSDATYNQYAEYLRGLSPSQRYLFFTSDQRSWRMRRWQVQYNMPQVDYEDLYNEFMTGGSGAGGSVSYYGPLGGVERWRITPN